MTRRSAARIADPSNIRLERMQLRDLDAVVDIERTFTAPWTRDMFAQELQHPPEAADTIVALSGDTLVGYVLVWFVADEVHIVNLAVHQAWRRLGIGRLLMDTVLERARARDMVVATLEVRCRNAAAIRLYESLGFARVAVRRHYYADNGEDAIVMVCALRERSNRPRPGPERAVAG